MYLIRHHFRQHLSAFLIATYLVLFAANAHAEANVCNAGIGGTGIKLDGIGGTGNDGGAGGTGAQANSGVGGTGIVGIITGFASVCVNGLEVHYDDKTKVDIDGQLSSINALDIGQLVAIESFGKDNLLKAVRMSVSHIMVGKIEKVNDSQNTLQILGQTIRYSGATVGSANLKVNQVVKVSGLQAGNNHIYALRIDLAAPSTPSSIVGLVSQTGDINGVRVMGDNRISAGKSMQVSGNWDGKTLRTNQVQVSAIDAVLRHSENVVVQGIAPVSANNVSVQNKHIQTDANTKTNGVAKGVDGNQTLIVRGKVDHAGNISARSIEYSAEDKILERGGSKHRPSLPEPTGRNSNKENDKQVLGKEKQMGSESHDSNNHDSKNQDSKNHPKNILDKLEGAEKPESVNKPEKIEKPEKVEKIEKIEKIEKPEKIVLPERVERPERVEKLEKIEIPEIPEH